MAPLSIGVVLVARVVSLRVWLRQVLVHFELIRALLEDRLLLLGSLLIKQLLPLLLHFVHCSFRFLLSLD